MGVVCRLWWGPFEMRSNSGKGGGRLASLAIKIPLGEGADFVEIGGCAEIETYPGRSKTGSRELTRLTIVRVDNSEP
jgi:hypothetical protein